MPKRVSLFLTLLIAAWPLMAAAQTAEDVINKSIEAHGGRANIINVHTERITGETKDPADGSVTPFMVYRTKPGKFRIEAEYQGKQIVQATDGKQAWYINPFSGDSNPKLMPEQQAKDFMRDVAFDGLDELITWKEKGDSVEYLGTVEIEGKNLYHLKFIEHDGKECNFYFDTKTNYMDRFTRIHIANGQETERLTILREFTDVGNGVIMGCTFEQQQGGKTTSTSHVTKFEINPANFDESIYTFPGNK